MIAEYNPYDQNATAPFFDPEWMFGPDVKDGFDIVIGNPPYGADTKTYLKSFLSIYPQAKKVPDSYCLFMAKGADLLKPNGTLSFIVPNTFCDLEKGDVFRRWLITEHTLKEIWQSGWAFESAIVDTLVFFIRKPKSPPSWAVTIGIDDTKRQRKLNEFIESPLCKIDYRIDSETKPLLEKVAAYSIPLVQLASVKAGVKMYEKGKGQPPQTEATMKERPYSKKGACPKGWKPLYRGADIGRFVLRQPQEFVKYGVWLAAPRTPETFKSPKILMRRTDDRILATIEEKDAVCVNSCHVIKLKESKEKHGDYLFALGVLNSQITQSVFELHNPQMVGKVFAEIKVVYVERLPIPTATPGEQAAIASKVEQILAAKAHDPAAEVSTLEREIDELVADLYGLDAAEKQLVGIE